MYVNTIKMDVDDFIKIKSNPSQRDTEHHAIKAKKKHLSKFHQSHVRVAIAILGNIQYILDGHTRKLLWNAGELKAPKVVYVDVFKVATKDELSSLYLTFDNKDATETVADQISGALRFMGIDNMNKNFSRNAGLRTAALLVNIAMKRVKPNATMIDLLSPYKAQIQIIANRNWLPSPKGLRPGTPSCAVAAFYITTKLDKVLSSGFWDGFYSGKGMESRKSGMDGSLAASKWLIRARNREEVFGEQNRSMGCEAILNGYQLYKKNINVKSINELYKRNRNLSYIEQLSLLLKKMGYK